MSEHPTPTTAAALLDFHKELTDGGIQVEAANHLLAIALNEIMQGEGLRIRPAVTA